ncbi:MAG: hypothetical protein ACRYGP_10595 [Janthinobacterium lividum]
MNHRSIERGPPRSISGLASASVVLTPSAASAHVKWFCGAIDLTSSPVPFFHVLSPIFMVCCVGFLLLVFTGLVADGWLARLRPMLLSTHGRLAWVEEAIVRIGIGAYCLLLWDNAASVPWGHIDEVVLTPELLGHDWVIDGLQGAVAVLVLSRLTCPLAALALTGLIGIGVGRYGIFHMTDYVFFVGYAAYLALTPWSGWSVRRWRLPILGTSLGFSLMWTAIEKFLYPQWTSTIMATHPNIAAGFPIPDVVVIAGFVEFSLAFYLVVGRGLLRVGALALMVVFISAMPEFGHLDVVGHIPIIAILMAVVVRGATPFQEALRLPTQGPRSNAIAICGLYLVTLFGMMAAYYGLQHTVGWI